MSPRFCRHWFVKPNRHERHSPQKSIRKTAPGVPTGVRVPGPAATTVPAASCPGVIDVPSKNCCRSEPQRALAPTRSKSSPVLGDGTSFSINLISLFPQKCGALEPGGMIVLIRDEMVDTLGMMVIFPCRSFQEICDDEASDG